MEMNRCLEIYNDLCKYLDEDYEVIGAALCCFLDSYCYKNGVEFKLDSLREEVFSKMGYLGAEV